MEDCVGLFHKEGRREGMTQVDTITAPGNGESAINQTRPRLANAHRKVRGERGYPVAENHYGHQVVVLDDPIVNTRLARICELDCFQTEFGRILRKLYRTFAEEVVKRFMPMEMRRVDTRMADMHPREGYVDFEAPRFGTGTVVIDVARAGSGPAVACQELAAEVYGHKSVRRDCVTEQRLKDKETHKVIGIKLNVSKVRGKLKPNDYVLVPEPFCATGGSGIRLKQAYDTRFTPEGPVKPQWIYLFCIAAPEGIVRLTKTHPDALIVCARVDRNLTPEKYMGTALGEYLEHERGLNERQYVVGGGGDFGDLACNTPPDEDETEEDDIIFLDDAN